MMTKMPIFAILTRLSPTSSTNDRSRSCGTRRVKPLLVISCHLGPSLYSTYGTEGKLFLLRNRKKVAVYRCIAQSSIDACTEAFERDGDD